MSKGIKDLMGIGKLVGECRKIVIAFLRHRAERTERELKNIEQTLKNDALRLKNQEAALRLTKRLFTEAEKRGWSAQEMHELVTQLACPKQLSTTERNTNGR